MEKRSTPTEFDIRAKERLNYLISKYCNGSQQELANRTGVGKASISQYVNGKNVPSNLTAIQICKPFRINPAWLMGFDAPMSLIESTGSTSSSFTLTTDEEVLIGKYRDLNDEGKEILLDQADTMVSSGKYIKSNEAGMVEEKERAIK